MTYEYQCFECGTITVLEQRMSEPRPDKTGIKCPCGDTQWRVYGQNIGDDHYANPIISDSLAMNPNQIAEHRELFPDVEVTPVGQPKFTSFKQHNSYLEKTGFRKVEQKVDGRHKKRIA